uniref:Uncharacterized protein n=1 Tax=Oryctolagus cuniculus TaxID=9986 RepID=A0A5F9DJD4_RABIT
MASLSAHFSPCGKSQMYTEAFTIYFEVQNLAWNSFFLSKRLLFSSTLCCEYILPALSHLNFTVTLWMHKEIKMT